MNEESEEQEREKQGRIHGIPVADGWAGARMRVFTLCDRFQLERDGPTDGPTNRRTDKASYRDARSYLKSVTD